MCRCLHERHSSPLITSGALKPTLTLIDFEEIAEGVDRLKRGEVTGRLVAKVAE